jgi:hypothetical protein
MIIFLLFFWSCEQPEPAFDNRDGDILQFADREWVIKHSEGPMGPGPNYFTDHPNDVFVDQNGYLHLSISERNGVWRCTEVVSVDTMGYGTYIWTIQGNPVNIDRNVVLGLFTWDTYTFQEQANSEVDIEFSKWGVADQDTTLQYGVQPINFGTYYPERDYKPEADPDLWIGVSTHAFTWTDTLITWESWRGDTYGNGTPDASWTFDLNNPPRSKYEGGLWSDPIIIPAPGENTNARMNLWLINGPEGPFIPVPHEMIIQNFEYLPL